ncbi:hypothetical protein D1AOALGA4SA_5405 [Olavius algarvensis Delta 1 endosymbiont]|nr:hypothetical protein D1AOALGA4SA_5405 [Olavius algarvensis Delta 1 endosymbiont]
MFLSLIFMSFGFLSCFVLRISDLYRCPSGLASYKEAS